MAIPKISQKYLEELETGPLGVHVTPLITRLRQEHYAAGTVLSYQLVCLHFARWMQQRKMGVHQICEADLDRFRRLNPLCRTNARAALRAMLFQLRSAGVTPAAVAPPRTPGQRLLEEYHSYLVSQRGLNVGTIVGYRKCLARFLGRLYGRGPVAVQALTAAALVSEVKRCLRKYSRGTGRIVIAALRSFLRYLVYRGWIGPELAAAVPSMAYWDERGLPRHVSAADVRRVLESCERQSVVGRRNYAMLLILAELGLRASELLALQLEDVDWLRGRLRIRSVKGGVPVWVPLPSATGAAMADYLRNARPACPCRAMFIRGAAPYVGLARAGDVSNIVREAIDRAGVQSRCRGAHVLRHSLATAMLRRGATLEEIGEMLRHRDVRSTQRYAKVDLESLRMLVVAWPGGAR
jgi:site-specific recombinase XerD